MAQMKNILLVEGEKDLCGALVEQFLITKEFQVVGVGSGQETLECVCDDLFDIIILDVALPDMDGRELCKSIRKEGVKCPILMLSGHDTVSDTILGLNVGANDYVTKPFKFSILLARIRSQLRLFEQSEDAIFTLGPYSFKPAAKMLINIKEQKIRLTEKETNILTFLLRADNTIVPRDILLHEVWGYNAEVTTHTLETHIYRLRQKIEPDPTQVSILITEGGGYKVMT